MIVASLGPLGGLLGALMGLLWCLLGRLGAILGVFESPWAVLEASWAAWVSFQGRHGSLGEPQGGAMAAQGPRGVRRLQSAVCEVTRGCSLRRLQKSCQAAFGTLPRFSVPRHGGGSSNGHSY